MSTPRFLWIDGIGGFAFCVGKRVSIGLATPNATVDLPVRGQLSKSAGEIIRTGDVDRLQSVATPAPNTSNGNDRLLAIDDQFVLGEVRFSYRRPSALSSTSRLDLSSPASWAHSIDGALLVGRTCLIGDSPSAHVTSHEQAGFVLLYAEAGDWYARFSETLMPSAPKSAPSKLVLGRRLVCEDYSICLE